MAIRIDATGDSIRTTTNLPSPAANWTACGWARVHAITAGYQNVFAIEDGTSNATGYGSCGFFPTTGNWIIDTNPSGSFLDLGSTPGALNWFFWFMRIDISTSPDTWTTGYRTLGGAWVTGSVQVNLSWTSALMVLGNNSYGEHADSSIATFKSWIAPLTLDELTQEMWSIKPVRYANLNRFARFRTTSDLHDHGGNPYRWTAAGTLTNTDDPPLPVLSRIWTVPFQPPGPQTVNVADTVTVSESVTALVVGGGVQAVNVSDTATVSEAVTVSLSNALTASVADTATITEAVTVSLPTALKPSVSDSVTVTESKTVSIGRAAYNPLTNGSGNPIIDNGPESYDEDKAGPRHVVKIANGQYVMLYEAGSAGGGSTAYATSSDGTSWTKYASNPVFVPTSGGWENDEASVTTFFWDASISKWVAYYHGGNNDQPRLIGRITADNLIGPWTRDASNPVLNQGGSGAWDEEGVADAKVMKVGSTYHMFYASDRGDGICIGHATSSDGITWTKDAANPVFEGAVSGWDSGDTQSAGVTYDAITGVFHMWYAGDNLDQGEEAIGYASSIDGTTWTRGPNNPVLTKPGTANVYIGDTVDAYADLQSGKPVYRVLYGHFDFNGAAERNIYEAYVITSDILVREPAVSDTVTVSESVTVSITRTRSVNDTATVSEAVTVALAAALAPSAADTVTVSDTPTVALAAAIASSVSDSVAASESVTVTVIAATTYTVNVNDTATVSEAVTVTSALTGVSVADTVTVTDAPNVLLLASGAQAINVSDNVTVTESVTVALVSVGGLSVNVNDTATISEAVNVALALSGVAVADTVTVTEVTAASIALPGVAVADSVTVSESATVLVVAIGVLSVNVTDTITVDDAPALTMALPGITAADTVTLTEDAAAVVGSAFALSISVADAVTVVDTAGLQMALTGVSVAETISVMDVLTIYMLGVVHADWTLSDAAVHSWSIVTSEVYQWSISDRSQT
jgi:hypothetical protein